MVLRYRSVATTRAVAKWAVISAAALGLLWPGFATAEYKLGSGDALELALAGSPDIHVRATVNLDGEVDLPLLGHVKVAGLSLSEIRAALQKSLQTKMLPRRGADGRETFSAIGPD